MCVEYMRFVILIQPFHRYNISFNIFADFLSLLLSGLPTLSSQRRRHSRAQSIKTIPTTSRPPNLHYSPDALPAHRANVDLFRTTLASGYMPTIIE